MCIRDSWVHWGESKCTFVILWNKRLSQLATLAIERELTFMCTNDLTIKENVIDFCKLPDAACGNNLQQNKSNKIYIFLVIFSN